MTDLSKIITVAAVAELGTALLLLLTPEVTIVWLLGTDHTAVATVFARLFGVSLLALVMACWPDKGKAIHDPAFRGMLFYNTALALYLTYLGVFVSSGWLLWPAVTFHTLITVLLLRVRPS